MKTCKGAINAVRENGLSKKLAARRFGVPRSTLIRKLSGQAPLLRKMGPPTELSKTEENVLVKWILAMAKKGFPAVSVCPKSGKILWSAKRNEDFYERVSSEKEQITVMATFSADGKVVPPMLIFPYKKMPKVIVESVPENWALGRSDSGWMNSEVFYEYIGNHLIPYLKSENIIRPVILFVDGHGSHLTQQVSQLCDNHGIVLVSLFPNTTHIMQPADVAVLTPQKSGWVSAVRDWKFQNFPKDVTRYTFGCILRPVFDQYATTKTIQNGFRKSGLYPFNKNNIDYTKCIPNRRMDDPFNNEKYPKNFQRKKLKII
ncbi:hypothetical protein NQ314_021385 [Rhamnusium bicolor]|uniref:Transposase n=1 Tax=Rhamnusium bicolor TaxID=1586634 RepID=A0AAV8WI85_9CUCU|nr:hypothetical protein NQ314_021385 [Rhamnusium bicolor]